MRKILAFRLSAMGDVALTVPVVRDFLEQHNDVELSLVTREFFKPMFYGIERLKLIFPDLEGKHKGLNGLLRLAKEISKTEKYDYVLDLHDVLRTKAIRHYFRYQGARVVKIDKGRQEKDDFIARKSITKLKHSVYRYQDVFREAGFSPFEIKPKALKVKPYSKKELEKFLEAKNVDQSKPMIGIAPFAKHRAKMWGLSKIEVLISLINEDNDFNFFLFGGGKTEAEALSQLAGRYPNVYNVAGNLDLYAEIALQERLNWLLSMDSSNMHMASLCGVKTISIWGGTHPDLGFSAFGQPDDHCIQLPIEEIDCRPCSVYGKKECSRKDVLYKCLEDIRPERVYEFMKDKKLIN